MFPLFLPVCFCRSVCRFFLSVCLSLVIVKIVSVSFQNGDQTINYCNCMQGLKKINRKLWEELITQTPCPTM